VIKHEAVIATHASLDIRMAGRAARVWDAMRAEMASRLAGIFSKSKAAIARYATEYIALKDIRYSGIGRAVGAEVIGITAEQSY